MQCNTVSTIKVALVTRQNMSSKETQDKTGQTICISMDLLTPKETLQQCTTSAYTEAEHQQEVLFLGSAILDFYHKGS